MRSALARSLSITGPMGTARPAAIWALALRRESIHPLGGASLSGSRFILQFYASACRGQSAGFSGSPDLASEPGVERHQRMIATLADGDAQGLGRPKRAVAPTAVTAPPTT
jgi:hypothetical protein